MSRILKYEQKDTWIDELTGVTKLLFFLLCLCKTFCF